MGVIYKLKEEVVNFIISQRQSSPLASCRQLAESASQKFDLRLSKSSVHDVLKESGIITPRGRKPKTKFEIPQEKKKQIQSSLSQVKLIPPLSEDGQAKISLIADVVKSKDLAVIPVPPVILGAAKPAPPAGGAIKAPLESSPNMEISPEYEEAGRIFLKAARWDLGIFSEEEIKATDWNYYLTYSKGIKVGLENNKSFFIDLPLPLERCIREAADGLINNVKPLIVHKVSDEGLFKACMDAQAGFKIVSISIVDEENHLLLELNSIVELNRKNILKSRLFVESHEIDPMKRLRSIFFPQLVDNNGVINNILNLKGFNATNKDENVVTLLIQDSYDNKTVLQEAAERLNGMYLRDEQDRLVSVKIGLSSIKILSSASPENENNA